MTHATSRVLASHALVVLVGLVSGPGEPEEKGTLAMSPAIACKAIEGYEQFEPLPDATLTSDEKLLVYYRPTGFQTERVGDQFRAHFVQDARIRRHGEKTVLMTKKKLLEYEAKSERPPEYIYLRNTISLKGLKPGHYELDIVLHDRIAGSSPVTQAMPFHIIIAAPPPMGGSQDQTEAP